MKNRTNIFVTVIFILGISLVLALNYIRFNKAEYKLFDKTFKYFEVEREIVFKNLSELKFNKNKSDFSIATGKKNILVIEESSKMIFAVTEDTLESENSKNLILLEFNPIDSVIGSRNTSFKRIYRKFRGKFIEIDSSENFEIRRISDKIYSLYFDLYDFKYKSVIDFNESERFIEKVKR